MSSSRPGFRHPDLAPNEAGYTIKDYEGGASTLCAGCGHDSISRAIVQAFFESNVPPHEVAKISGIGCSSKTPAYFLGRSHGFNSVHGRMPSIATGANMANKDLVYLGVSGDGDTASIGAGQFIHVIRRNLNMIYIVMNNGCYGLTKGQDSATADKGSTSRKGAPNLLESIDLCEIAIQMGASFVARGFSGDKQQLIPLIKAAIGHKGTAVIDVISPCVTFNNTPQSTKSYQWVREHSEATGTFDFIPLQQEITAAYKPGEVAAITLHDGSVIHLHKTAEDFDITNRRKSLDALEEAREKHHILTGAIYVKPDGQDTHELLSISEKKLNSLGKPDLCPGNSVLQTINDQYR